ncbi:MAG TPA: hypothetical protein VLU06_12760 [Thermoanaerobaculia bacterium]|nr:hypothetical protein [Thermoanaerobaculia bacterium]
MPQTRLFRDRVVSMEQTLEGGEKNLELLKTLCREALPEFTFREYTLDHERDVFVMVLEAPDGRMKRVCWTRMMLFDAERIPSLSGDPLAALRSRIVDFLRSRSGRPEIVVTFRHLEEGWVDTLEPRREKRRRRGRGDRGRREGRRESPAPAPGRPAALPPQRVAPPARERRPQPPAVPVAGPASEEAARPQAGRRRRRFRRRRRGRGPGGPAAPGPSGPARTP